jgi:putative transferase (TIGR04331 family)
MFLVVTSDHRFWKKSERILFLGEWCQRYSQKKIWSSLEFEVIPHHWNDSKKKFQDFIYLEAVYERHLLLLADQLNAAHKTSFSTRYWRILVGPWLRYFIEIFYDRYSSIISAIETGKVSNTWLPIWEPNDFIPMDFESFWQWCYEDEYNHYLYGWLMKNLEGNSYEIKEDIPCGVPRKVIYQCQFLGVFKNLTKSFFEYYNTLIPERWKEVVFCSSYLTSWQLIKLQVSLGQAPAPCTPRIFWKDEVVDEDLRGELAFPKNGDQFESLIKKIIPTQLPKIYLESFASFRQKSLKRYPKKTKVIYATNALYLDEGFKFWAAERIDNGGKLIAGQHGGTYGSALLMGHESHETKVSDRFFTWGWADEKVEKLVSVPAAQLIKAKDEIKPNCDGYILWLPLICPRYEFRMVSLPFGANYVRYMEDQETFASFVNPDVYDLLIFRIQKNIFSSSLEDRCLDEKVRFGKIYRGKKTMAQQLSECRLSIATYNSTTFLETFVANYPTIMFWNPKHSELRKSAQPYYDDLRRAEILHDSPESAAAKANDIYRDPLSWWMSEKVQASKDRFSSRFARLDPNWMQIWKEEFLRIK